MSQVQGFIFDYNLERSVDSSSMSPNSQKLSREKDWNFPGLKMKRRPEHPMSPSKDPNSLNEGLVLQQRAVMQIVDRLKLCAHRCQYTPQQPLVEMRRILNTLDKSFNTLVDMMMTKEMKVNLRISNQR